MKNDKTVVLGMSGGVDSSVAALLLKKQGYKVVGVFMKNYSDTKNKLTGECSWVEERKSAQKIAAMLGIPLITVDYEDKYKKEVIESMYKDYTTGLTPNPDTLCNKIIKFPALWKEAQKLKADYIATGHYARIKKTSSGFELLQGKDEEKDQSYFLYELTQKDLAHLLFPVGNLTKNQVRKIAKKYKFPNWKKQGTRGICFIGKINMKEFLKRKIKEKPGKIVSPEGEILGSHPGKMFFTIGERLGEARSAKLDVHKEKLYVAKKIGSTIIAVPKNHELLKTKIVVIKNMNIINPKDKIPKTNLKARIRHLGKMHSGRLVMKRKKCTFKFSKSVAGVAPGQAIVIYSRQKLICGGEIAKTE